MELSYTASSYTEPFLYMIAPIIAAPKPNLDAKAEKCKILKPFQKDFKYENHKRQHAEHVLTNHHRDLHAAIPIRFAMFSCKRQ